MLDVGYGLEHWDWNEDQTAWAGFFRLEIITLLNSWPAAILLLGSVLGLVVGSFLNVVIIRLPTLKQRLFKWNAIHWYFSNSLDKLSRSNSFFGGRYNWNLVFKQ